MAAPLVLSVLLPAPAVRPTTGSADATTLALTAQSTLLRGADSYRRLEAEVAVRQAVLREAMATEAAARAAVGSIARAAAALYVAGPQARYSLTLDAAPSSATPQPLAVLRQSEQQVTAAKAAVDSATRSADRLLVRVRQEAAGLEPEVSSTLAGLSTAPAAGSQQTRDQQAVARWQQYLEQLAGAGIQPPPAAAIADLDHLPDGLAPALDATRHRIPGVVTGVVGNHPVTVLPAETVAAVSAALSQLGKPFALSAVGPDSYDCGGFTSASWLLAGYALSGTPQEQWAGGAPVGEVDLQVGDLVFSPGGQDVGLYLGDGEVLGASAASARVSVRDLQPGSRGVRVTLPRPAEQNAPLPVDAVAGYCGAPAQTADPAWGGYANGRISSSQLCPLGVAGHELRCDAAAAYRTMSAAFAAAFGSPLCITDSYRSYAAQVTAFRAKPALAAVPGTSNHGWGLAVDLCGGINVAGTPQWTWMQANAGRFGFVNPPWARPGAEKPEPWHWEFGNFG